MRNVSLFAFALSLFFFASFDLSGQTKAERKVVAKTSDIGMYNSSKSPEALKYYSEGEDFQKAEEWKKAIASYKKALKADPNFVEVYDNCGASYRRLGDLENAIKCYKKSIELYPQGPMAHMNLGLVYAIQKKFDDAIAEYEALQKISPDDPEGYYGTINIYIQKKDYKSAIKNAAKTLEIYEAIKSPYLSDGQYLLGLSYYYDGDTKNAKIYLEQAKKSGVKVPDKICQELSIK
jgi:tetratricopeptide (TPR) repeat protein